MTRRVQVKKQPGNYSGFNLVGLDPPLLEIPKEAFFHRLLEICAEQKLELKPTRFLILQNGIHL